MQSNLPSSSAGSSASFGSSSEQWKTVGAFKKPPKNIVITKTTLSDMKLAKEQTKQAIALNKKEQQRVDLDVILSGFLNKPNVDETVKKLVELFRMSMNEIKLYHTFENRVRTSDGSSRVYHHISITLKDKTAKLKLIKAKSDMKSPIRLSMLVSKTSKTHDPIITCLPSLSKFNYSVQKQLTKLQTHCIINEFEFGDTFHRIKVNPSSLWKEVTHLGILDELNEELAARKKTMNSRT